MEGQLVKITKRDFLVGAGAGLAGAGTLRAVQALWPNPHPERPPAPDEQPEAGLPQATPPEGVKLSYAQFGEDLVVASLFDWISIILKPLPLETYIDIGTYEPLEDNNTYFFYLRGARGVLVEPNPALIPKIKEVRPEDKVLNVGIGVTDQSQADYYIIKDLPGMNTFSKEQAAQLPVERVVKMPLVNVNKVIAEHLGKAPDFFSIDIEGLDLAILKTLDFAKYRPKAFCAETLQLGIWKHNTEITAFMASKDYVLAGLTVANSVYIDKGIFNPW